MTPFAIGAQQLGLRFCRARKDTADSCPAERRCGDFQCALVHLYDHFPDHCEAEALTGRLRIEPTTPLQNPRAQFCGYAGAIVVDMQHEARRLAGTDQRPGKLYL